MAFDPASLFAMMSGMGGGAPGMMPGMMPGLQEVPGIGGLGKVPGMGQVDLGKGMSGIMGGAYDKVPGKGKAAQEDAFAAGPKGDKAGGMATALGMEALSQMAGPQKSAPPGMTTAAAPRGNQVKLENNDRKQYDVALQKASLAQLLFGR